MSHSLYSPGLHKLLTLKVDEQEKLIDVAGFISFTDSLLIKFGLKKVGLSSHTFENNSYTAAYCLMESHICIHTWPEFRQLTMDIYLCNYLQDNSEKVEAVGNEYIRYFEAQIIKEFNIDR